MSKILQSYKKNYRNLTKEEIICLEKNSCCCSDWSNVKVAWGKESYTDYIRGVFFSGKIYIGVLKGEKESVANSNEFNLHCGLYNATLHNVSIGDNCLIRNIGDHIANYNIGENSSVINVDSLAVDSLTTFGNGVNVSVLNETGGREVIITNLLSAHTAYIMALYRHHPLLHKKLCEIANKYADECKSDIGEIGANVDIKNCGTIVNVKIGEYAKLVGVRNLYNGSINSKKGAEVFIGNGVIMRDFILSSGAVIDTNAIVNRCFIGQSCHLGNGYSAIDSLFFANCHGENGEACSIFAGPYTVTHHKSTLLIAGMFSFMNAGSGSNQSNHMYKLGPIHQGILERGAKTTSDSYILWPSKVGAFSLVMGRHVTHSDTSIFPFSYLIEQNNTTFLSPGVNLRSVGTIRDAQKWPKRDSRSDTELLDMINYNMLNPFVIQKMFKGIQALNNLLYSSGELSDIYSYHSAKITNRALRKGIQLYETGITKYLGNLIISRLQVGGAIKPLSKFAKVYSTAKQMELAKQKLKGKTLDQKIRIALRKVNKIGEGDWADVSGLYAPREVVDKIIEKIEKGVITKYEQINKEFKMVHESYYDMEWSWAYNKVEEFFKIDLSSITSERMIEIIKKWEIAVVELDKMVYEDAKKEFSLASMTGFGTDGSKSDKKKDFEVVRGDFESNTFVNAVLEHIKKKKALANAVINELK